MQIQHSDDDLQHLGWNCMFPARQQLQNLSCNQSINVILFSYSKKRKKSFLLFYHVLDNVKQFFASLAEITIFCNTPFLWLCKTQILFLNPLAGSIQKTAECIFHVHSRPMATRTLTSRRNLEIELSNILILGAIFVFIFSGCKTYLSVRSFVEGISAPSDHYPHHPKHYENINRQV